MLISHTNCASGAYITKCAKWISIPQIKSVKLNIYSIFTDNFFFNIFLIHASKELDVYQLMFDF